MQEGIYHDNFKGHEHPLVAQNKALLARHNALVEAVDRLVTSIDEDDVNEYRLSRAWVDRLIANEPEPAE